METMQSSILCASETLGKLFTTIVLVNIHLTSLFQATDRRLNDEVQGKENSPEESPDRPSIDSEDGEEEELSSEDGGDYYDEADGNDTNGNEMPQEEIGEENGLEGEDDGEGHEDDDNGSDEDEDEDENEEDEAVEDEDKEDEDDEDEDEELQPPKKKKK